MLRQSRYEIKATLKKTGFKLTRQRIAIIEYVAERTDHPSILQIFEALHEKISGLSLATIYNTLNSLVKIGVIKEIEFGDSEKRFDTNLSPHINLLCRVCGTIEDYPSDLPLHPQKLIKETGFQTIDFRIVYRGICKSCQK